MTSDEITEYMLRAFSIDCPRMVLRKNTEAPDRVYEGPGRIYQTPEGELMVKLYASGPRDLGEFARIIQSGPKPGEIIPRHEYFSLEATSMKGATWRGEFVLPGVNQGVTGGPIVTGALYELVETTEDLHSREQRSYLSLIFGEDFDFPGNTSTTTKTFLGDKETGMSGDWTPAVFGAAGLEFQLQRKGEMVYLSAESKNTILPRYLDSRISETLEFTFFEPHKWVIRTVQESGQIATTLRPFPKKRIKKTPTPPVGFVGRLTTENVWNLFSRYPEYVLTYPKAEWHPLSDSVHLAVTGDENPLSAGLLALSVSVEGVLKTGFSNLALPDQALREQIKSASKLVSDSSLTDTFKKRLLGNLGAMHSPRAVDKLRVLVEAGLIREELKDAWVAIRNPTVHAGELDPTARAEIFRKYQSSLTLFNELVFLVIGYVSLYTDYSIVGWPLRNFEKTMKNVDGNADQSSESPAELEANEGA